MANGYYDTPAPRKGGKRRRNAGNLPKILILICIIAVAVIFCKLIFGRGDKQASADPVQPQQVQEVKKEYNVPPAAEENDLMKIVREEQGSEAKICYLTFDDGPTKDVTPKVLDILKKYDVPATFFCLGKMLDANRDIAERAHSEGHLLANHSYNHDYNKLYATSESFMEEIEKTEGIIKEICGDDVFRLMRFPGGSYNSGDHAAEKQQYKKVLADAGYYYIDWNCLNGDAEASLRDVDSLVAKVKNTATEDNIVVLMHDASTKKTTPDALGQIIEYLKGQGYEFRRLDEVDYYNNDKAAARQNENSIIL